MAEKEALQTLKDALTTSKQMLREQGAVLKRLAAEPLRFATVVAIREPETILAPIEKAPTPASPEELTPGTKVRVLDGRFKDMTGTVGSNWLRQDFVPVYLAFENAVPVKIVLVFEYWFYVGQTGHRVGQIGNRMFSGNLVEPASGPAPRILKVGDKVRVVDASKVDGRIKEGMQGFVVDECVHPGAVDASVTVEFRHLFTPTLRFDFVYKPPCLLALVEESVTADTPRRTAIVLFDGKEVEVVLPPDKPVQVGDAVKLSMQSFEIVDVGSMPLAGEVVGVQSVLDEASSEVDVQGGTRAVYNGRFSGQLKEGDRVVLDSSGLVIIRSLTKEREAVDEAALR